LDARISPDSQSDGYEPSVLETPEPIAAGEGAELPFINWGDNIMRIYHQYPKMKNWIMQG
jgi:hypothetical protein